MSIISAIFGGKSGATVAARKPSASSILGGNVAMSLSGGVPASSIDPELLREHGEFLSRRERPPRAKHLHIPHTVTRALYEMPGEPLVLPEELETLKNLQIECDRINVFALQHLQANADDAWLEQQRRDAADVAAGKGKEVSAREGWTREDWRSDFQEKRRALQKEYRTIAAKSQPVAFAVAARIGERAGKVHTEIHVAERHQAAVFGLEFKKSRLLEYLDYLSTNHAELVNTCGGNSPKLVLEFAGIKL